MLPFQPVVAHSPLIRATSYTLYYIFLFFSLSLSIAPLLLLPPSLPPSLSLFFLFFFFFFFFAFLVYYFLCPLLVPETTFRRRARGGTIDQFLSPRCICAAPCTLASLFSLPWVEIRISIGQVRRGKRRPAAEGFEFSFSLSTSLKPSDSLLQIIKLFVVAAQRNPARSTPLSIRLPGPSRLLWILSTTLDCETATTETVQPPIDPA